MLPWGASKPISTKRLFPDLAYTFKHGLTRQVAYNTLQKGAERLCTRSS